MGKRILITATDLMTVQFLLPHVKNLAKRGYDVELACSDVGGRLHEAAAALTGKVCAIHTLHLKRSPLSPGNLLGLWQLKKLIRPGKYQVIWTNEPVMGVMTRLAARSARKSGTKVVYMCHGFHFCKGSGLAGWLLFYPVERFLSRFTDVLVTVNREDEVRARTFHAGRVEYIHGIGVNTARLRPRREPGEIRKALALTQRDFVVLSVGELNKNKNHAVVLRALAQLQDPDIHYVICGKGAMQKSLERLAKRLGLSEQVHFPGYRKDVADFLEAADIFVFPSKREGLGLAPLEAMYCGLPLIVSDIRGVRDYTRDGESGFLCRPSDAAGFARAIGRLKESDDLRRRCGAWNRKAVMPFCLAQARQAVLALFEGIEENGQRSDL